VTIRALTLRAIAAGAMIPVVAAVITVCLTSRGYLSVTVG
jgi:hypothetical protein